MDRYSRIPIVDTKIDQPKRYAVVKYPKLLLDPSDIYVYVTQGDRYDTLAQAYYNDPTLWWVINRANPSQDPGSLFPAVGSQIRIPSPSNVSLIITQYERLN